MDLFMAAAIEEAKKGANDGGIPIGSVLVRGDEIIGRGHNKRVQENDPIKHAEIDCLYNAGRIGSYRGTVLYSTLMPCFLCAGAVVQFGIKKVIVGENLLEKHIEACVNYPLVDKDAIKSANFSIVVDIWDCYSRMQIIFFHRMPGKIYYW